MSPSEWAREREHLWASEAERAMGKRDFLLAIEATARRLEAEVFRAQLEEWERTR